jgi:hypothetical protein
LRRDRLGRVVHKYSWWRDEIFARYRAIEEREKIRIALERRRKEARSIVEFDGLHGEPLTGASAAGDWRSE